MQGYHGLIMTESSEQACSDDPYEGAVGFAMYTGDTYVGMIFAWPNGSLEQFIGVVLPASGGLLDTGAQHGVIGRPSLKRLS